MKNCLRIYIQILWHYSGIGIRKKIFISSGILIGLENRTSKQNHEFKDFDVSLDFQNRLLQISEAN